MTINSACLSKSTYETKKEAESHIVYINKTREVDGLDTIYLKVYKCPFCSKFHLSKAR